MKNTIAAILLLTMFAATAFAAGDGTSAAAFLKIGAGAKSAAMGGAGSASSGADAVYWNPAGLAFSGGNEAVFSHALWLEEIAYSHIAGALVAPVGAFGIGVTYLSVPPMDRLDASGNVPSDAGTFTASDLAATVSYARKAFDVGGNPAAVGASVKYISSAIENETAAAMAFDVGAQMDIAGQNIKLAVVAQNIGAQMKFLTESDPLPAVVKVGAAWAAPVGGTSPLNLVLDANLPAAGEAGFNFGAEYPAAVSGVTVALRAGYHTDNKGLDGGNAGLSAGIGLGIKSYRLDYAFVPYGVLGDTHRVSVLIKF